MKCVLHIIFALICAANSAKILGIVPTPSYSHQIAYQSLWKELSLRGHHVTTITTQPINDPKLVNLTEIDVKHLQTNSLILEAVKDSGGNTIAEVGQFLQMMIQAIDVQLDYDPIKRLINDQDENFDLVIVEYFFGSPLAFAARFNCPSIGMLSVDGWNVMHHWVGSPTHPILYPNCIAPFPQTLSLVERVANFFHFISAEHLFDNFARMEDGIVTKHFGSDYPPVQELRKSISMLFSMSDPVFHPIKPLVPAVVQIGGGVYRLPSKPLSKDLKMILDNASNGFIYFSLGSNMQSGVLPSKMKEVLVSTFAELSYVVLWKFEGDALPNKSDNVVISKWLPQKAVMEHPNIKLFITQGGLQSMDEAIYEHVPMIGIPFFGDQPFNVKKMVRKGFGLEIDYRTLEKKTFKEAILEVINNPKYKKTLKYLADLAQDQPMTGLEKAVWWSEYVIRHKGARHLRSPLLDIPWYQYLLLDVIGVIALVVLVIVGLIYFILKSIIKLLKYIFWSKPKPKEKKN